MAFLDDIAKYEERFPAFVSATDEKYITNAVLNHLFTRLVQCGVLANDRVSQVLDIGCGEGKNGEELCRAINFSTGQKVVYQGVDISSEFVDSIESRLSRQDFVESVKVRQASCYDGHKMAENGSIDLAVGSHMLYYATTLPGRDPAEIFANVFKTTQNCLSDKGVGIFIHQADRSPWLELNKIANSGTSTNVTELLLESSQSAKHPHGLLAIDIPARAAFPDLTEEQWKALCNTSEYEKHSEDENFLLALKLIGFAAFRDLRDIEKEGKLEELVNGFKVEVERTNGFIELRDQIQIVPSQEMSKEDFEKLSKAVLETQKAVDQIYQQIPAPTAGKRSATVPSVAAASPHASTFQQEAAAGFTP